MTRRLSCLLALACLLLFALPASALAFEPLANFGAFGEAAGQLQEAEALTIAPDGTTYVADKGNERIDVFSARGAFLYAFGEHLNLSDQSNLCNATSGCVAGLADTAAGAFHEPEGVAIGPEGNLFIADGMNNRIDTFTPGGEFIRAFGKAVNLHPTGAADADVCTAGSGCKAGALSALEGVTGAGAMKHPEGLSFDSAGELLVADSGNVRIDVFSPSGQFLRAFAKGVDRSPGATNENLCDLHCNMGLGNSSAGSLEAPADVEAAPNGEIFVASSTSDRIDVFGADDSFIRAFGKNVNPEVNPGANHDVCTLQTQCQRGSASAEAGTLGPLALAVDSQHVYVSDPRLNRIDEFGLDGGFIRAFGAGVANGGNAFEICEQTCQAGLRVQLPGSASFAEGVALDCHGALYASVRQAPASTEPFSYLQRFGERGTPTCDASTSPPSNKFKFGKLALNKRTGTATLAVIVPGPGSLVLRGKGLRVIKRSARGPGTLKLAIQPLGRAKRALSRHGTLKLRVQVTFAPVGGRPATQARLVRLKRAPAAPTHRRQESSLR